MRIYTLVLAVGIWSGCGTTAPGQQVSSQPSGTESNTRNAPGVLDAGELGDSEHDRSETEEESVLADARVSPDRPEADLGDDPGEAGDVSESGSEDPRVADRPEDSWDSGMTDSDLLDIGLTDLLDAELTDLFDGVDLATDAEVAEEVTDASDLVADGAIEGDTSEIPLVWCESAAAWTDLVDADRFEPNLASEHGVPRAAVTGELVYLTPGTPAIDSELNGSEDTVTLRLAVDFDSPSQSVVLTVDFAEFPGGAVREVWVDLFDVDKGASGRNSWQDWVSVQAYHGETPRAVRYSYVVGLVDQADGGVYGLASIDNESDDGTVGVFVESPIDRIVMTYGEGPAAGPTPSQHGIAVGGLRFEAQACK